MPDDKGNPVENTLPSDGELMGRVRAGDPEVLRTLLTRHLTQLRRYAEGLLDRPEDAEDVVQEAFVRLWEKRETWRIESSVRAILFTLTRNAAVDLLRRKRRETQLPDGWAETIPSFGPSPLHQALEGELTLMAEDAVSRLPPRRQEVFRLIREGGLSYKEVATALEIAPQTVANLMALALSDLRLSLKAILKPRPEEPALPSEKSAEDKFTGSS